MAVGLEYYLMKTGPCAINGIESLSHFNPDDMRADPTIQCLHSPVIVDAGLGQADAHPGLILQTVVLQPSCHGTLTLRDADLLSHPVIDPNYLADPEDMRRMVGGLRYVRGVLKAPTLANILSSDLESDPDFSTDEGVADHAWRTMATM